MIYKIEHDFTDVHTGQKYNEGQEPVIFSDERAAEIMAVAKEKRIPLIKPFTKAELADYAKNFGAQVDTKQTVAEIWTIIENAMTGEKSTPDGE